MSPGISAEKNEAGEPTNLLMDNPPSSYRERFEWFTRARALSDTGHATS